MSNSLWNLHAVQCPEAKSSDFEEVTEWAAEEIESLRQQLASLKAELKAIGKAIDDPRTDLTMTMSEVIVEQKQQLVEGQAALAVKDAAIKEWLRNIGGDYTEEQMEEALAIQPDDIALREWGARLLEEVANNYMNAPALISYELFKTARDFRLGKWKPEI